MPGLGGKDIVDAAGVLSRFQALAFLVDSSFFVEDLDFHAHIRGVAFKGSANADTIIAAVPEAPVQAKDEVGILFFGEEVASSVGGADEDLLVDDIARAVALDQRPAAKVLTIEQRGKAFFGSVCQTGGGEDCAEFTSSHRSQTSRT